MRVFVRLGVHGECQATLQAREDTRVRDVLDRLVAKRLVRDADLELLRNGKPMAEDALVCEHRTFAQGLWCAAVPRPPRELLEAPQPALVSVNPHLGPVLAVFPPEHPAHAWDPMALFGSLAVLGPLEQRLDGVVSVWHVVEPGIVEVRGVCDARRAAREDVCHETAIEAGNIQPPRGTSILFDASTPRVRAPMDAKWAAALVGETLSVDAAWRAPDAVVGALVVAFVPQMPIPAVEGSHAVVLAPNGSRLASCDLAGDRGCAPTGRARVIAAHVNGGEDNRRLVALSWTARDHVAELRQAIATSFRLRADAVLQLSWADTPAGLVDAPLDLLPPEFHDGSVRSSHHVYLAQSGRGDRVTHAQLAAATGVVEVRFAIGAPAPSRLPWIDEPSPPLSAAEYVARFYADEECGFLALSGKMSPEEENLRLLEIVALAQEAEVRRGADESLAGSRGVVRATDSERVPRSAIRPARRMTPFPEEALGDREVAGALAAELVATGVAFVRLTDATRATVRDAVGVSVELFGSRTKRTLAPCPEDGLPDTGYVTRPEQRREIFAVRDFRRTDTPSTAEERFSRHPFWPSAMRAFHALRAIAAHAAIATLHRCGHPNPETLVESSPLPATYRTPASLSNLTFYLYQPAEDASEEPTPSCLPHTDVGLVTVIPVLAHREEDEGGLSVLRWDGGWEGVEQGVDEGIAVILLGETMHFATGVPGTIHQVAHVARRPRSSLALQLQAAYDAIVHHHDRPGRTRTGAEVVSELTATRISQSY